MILSGIRTGQLSHLGLVAPNYGPGLGPAALRAGARCAEEVGADAVWVTDHVAVPSALAPTYGSITEALVTAAFLGACTSSIDVGVSALVVPQRPALLTLKQVMSTQLLTEGRLVLAVAAGWTEQEFRNLGASMANRGQSLDRWTALVQAAVRSGPGRLDVTLPDMQITDAYLAPGFVDEAPPPIWIAGHAKPALRRAADTGTWHPVGRPQSLIAELVRELRALNPQARTVLRMAVTRADQPDRDALDADGRCRIIGPTDFVVDQLARFQAAGCDGFVIDLLTGEGHFGDRIEWFWGEVVPQLRTFEESGSGTRGSK